MFQVAPLPLTVAIPSLMSPTNAVLLLTTPPGLISSVASESSDNSPPTFQTEPLPSTVALLIIPLIEALPAVSTWPPLVILRVPKPICGTPLEVPRLTPTRKSADCVHSEPLSITFPIPLPRIGRSQ